MSAKTDLRNRFLHQVEVVVKVWEGYDHLPEREKLEGVAFSILNILDGNSMAVPPLAVSPIDEEGNIDRDVDIAGALHELVFKKREEK